jgi:phage gpG-like protein
MLRFTGEVLGERQFDRALTRLQRGVTDLKPLFELLGEDFRETERQQFDHEGYGWAPLSPGYAIRKRALWGDKPILQASGAMRSAMTERMTPGNVTTIKETEAEFGVNLGKPYPRFHQSGAPRANLPQRKVIDLREADKRRMTKTMHRYFVQISREAGFAVVGA